MSSEPLAAAVAGTCWTTADGVERAVEVTMRSSRQALPRVVAALHRKGADVTRLEFSSAGADWSRVLLDVRDVADVEHLLACLRRLVDVVAATSRDPERPALRRPAPTHLELA